MTKISATAIGHALRDLVARAQTDIKTLRDEIAALKEERKRVAAAPRPKDVAAADLDRVLTARADAFANRIDVLPLALPGHNPFDLDVIPHVNLSSPADRAEFEEFMLFAAGDVIRRRLVETLDRWYASQPCKPMTDEERAAALAKIDARLSELEGDEEATISTAEVNGMLIARRPDADPRVVLGVTD